MEEASKSVFIGNDDKENEDNEGVDIFQDIFEEFQKSFVGVKCSEEYNEEEIKKNEEKIKKIKAGKDERLKKVKPNFLKCSCFEILNEEDFEEEGPEKDGKKLDEIKEEENKEEENKEENKEEEKKDDDDDDDWEQL